MVCHSLLQWTTFCQTSPPWPARLVWPHKAWLSFTELDKAVVHVIKLTSFLWLWFQCICPLMPSHNTYCLTSVLLTLDVGFSSRLLQQSAAAAPYLGQGISPHCCLSWPWMWSRSSWLIIVLTRERLIEFCQENALVIANTLFQQHKRTLYTWTSPDGQHQNQTDYILCSQRWRSSIQSAKTRPGGWLWLRSWTLYCQIQT